MQVPDCCSLLPRQFPDQSQVDKSTACDKKTKSGETKAANVLRAEHQREVDRDSSGSLQRVQRGLPRNIYHCMCLRKLFLARKEPPERFRNSNL